MTRETVHQSLRYLAVSGTGLAVNVLIFTILSRLGLPTLVCGALAFAGACQHNVTWHARITFDTRTHPSPRRSARFFALSLATLGANLLVLAALQSAGLPALIAQAAGIAVAAPLNLLGCRSWVFVKQQPDRTNRADRPAAEARCTSSVTNSAELDRVAPTGDPEPLGRATLEKISISRLERATRELARTSSQLSTRSHRIDEVPHSRGR